MRNNKELRPIDKPFYHYWQALYLSFFSSRFYVDVGKRWKGFGVLYLFFLLCIAALPISLRVGVDFNRFFNERIIGPLLNLPPLIIQEGKLSFDKPMPYFIKDDTGQVTSIIDTTGTVKDMDAGIYPNLAVLFTKDKVFYRFPAPQFFFSSPATMKASPIYMQPLSERSNEIFDGKRWAQSPEIRRTKLISAALIYPTMVTVFFSMYLTLLLVFSLMAQFIAKYILKYSLNFKQACRLLIVSATPHIIVLLFLLTLHGVFPGLGIVLLALLAAYYSFAVLALKRDGSKLVVV